MFQTIIPFITVSGNGGKVMYCQVAILPARSKALVTVNPLSYVIDAIRSLLVTGDFSHLILDFGLVIVAPVVMLILAGWSFNRITT